MNQKVSDPAEYFEDMAARIRRNPGEFRGAYCVVGPDGTSILNAFFGPESTTSTAVFWGMAKNHIGLEADEAARKADQNNQTNLAYGRR